MASPPSAGGRPLAGKHELIAYIAGGEKPPEQWLIGTEHEKFVFRLSDHTRAPYEGPDGIRALLNGLARFGWEPVLESGNPIAMTRNGASISLEPGGQFELSGAPLRTLHETCSEVNEHLREVKEVCGELGLGMLGVGFDPLSSRSDVPWMPKGRYKIMREYMPKVGSLGLDMMLRTCTVQVNLDFASEADMVKKFRVSLALQPLATALFAASPFSDGKPNGFRSYRSHIWTDTDPDRCGMLPFVFEAGFGYERYVDYLLDMPMYFVYRDGAYIDASGQSFRDFMAGKLPALPGEVATRGDFIDHMSTAFPEVRLKKYLEMRGADGGPWRRLCALPAFWVGLLYDDLPLDAAWDLVKDWTVEEMETQRVLAPRMGLDTPFRGETLRDLSIRVLAVAREGLRRRARISSSGEDESHFLDTLFAIAGSGRTLSDELLEAYHGDWAHDLNEIYRNHAY
jgi:glutamate--cysteine ligase